MGTNYSLRNTLSIRVYFLSRLEHIYPNRMSVLYDITIIPELLGRFTWLEPNAHNIQSLVIECIIRKKQVDCINNA